MRTCDSHCYMTVLECRTVAVPAKIAHCLCLLSFINDTLRFNAGFDDQYTRYNQSE
jgi:hypothetical protein